MIQTFFNTDGTGLTAIITVIVDGAHVDPDSWPITNDPAIVLSSHPSASKTVTAIDTGVFKAVWSSLSPALAHGDVVFIAVDGEISATAWTTWQIPVQVVWLPVTAEKLTTERLTKIDGAMQAGADGDTGKTLSDQIDDSRDMLGYTLAALAGTCSDAGTSAETYTITIGADTFTIDHTGLDATGNRGTATLTKS